MSKNPASLQFGKDTHNMGSFCLLLLSVLCIFVAFHNAAWANDQEEEIDGKKEEPNDGIKIYSLSI